MAQVTESVLRPASGGFGMYDLSAVCDVDDCESFADWVALAEANEFKVEEAPDISGKVYGQSGAHIYRLTDLGGEESLHAVWVEA